MLSQFAGPKLPQAPSRGPQQLIVDIRRPTRVTTAQRRTDQAAECFAVVVDICRKKRLGTVVRPQPHDFLGGLERGGQLTAVTGTLMDAVQHHRQAAPRHG